MTSRDFCYWLQGYFEIEGNQPRPPEFLPTLNSEQVKMIKNHLRMVFMHEIYPSFGDKKKQEQLNEAHAGTNPASGYIGNTDPSKPDFLVRC